MTHIGKKIEEVVRLRKITIVSLAREINTTRNNIYNIFNRESIDTKLLSKISKHLNYNFFEFLSKTEQVRILNSQPNIEDIAAEHALCISRKDTSKIIEELKKENKELKKRLKEKEIIISSFR